MKLRLPGHLRLYSFSPGVTLVELTIYLGVLSTILIVLYQLFAFAGSEKLTEVATDELYVVSERIFSDLRYEITTATSIDTPSTEGESADTLVLSGGDVSYAVNASNILEKTDGAGTHTVTSDNIIVPSLSFTRIGPSTESATIKAEVTLRSTILVGGSYPEETFQTAVTMR